MIANLEGGSSSTDLGKAIQESYFNFKNEGHVVDLRYGKLQAAFAAQPIALGLYCDGLAFEWVTASQEGDKAGETLPNGGRWHSKEGRFNPTEGPLYLDGMKRELRTNICQTLDGKIAEGASAIRGKHIILCPDAFTVPVQETILLSEQTIGTSLDTLTSTDAVLLHELIHCGLANGDTV